MKFKITNCVSEIYNKKAIYKTWNKTPFFELWTYFSNETSERILISSKSVKYTDN